MFKVNVTLVANYVIRDQFCEDTQPGKKVPETEKRISLMKWRTRKMKSSVRQA